MNSSQTKICLIGGTFDPIHLGHTYIASQAVKQLGLDKVIFIPCRKSPHKMGKKSVSAEHRLAMCQLAVHHLPWAEVSDYDLVAPSPSFSWRTAEHFSKLYPDAEIYWLMGCDQWVSLPRWNRADHFANLVKIIVSGRDFQAPTIHGFSCLNLSDYLHPASATAIRLSISSGSESKWLSPAVHHYLKENRLYLKSHLD